MGKENLWELVPPTCLLLDDPIIYENVEGGVGLVEPLTKLYSHLTCAVRDAYLVLKAGDDDIGGGDLLCRRYRDWETWHIS